MKKAPETGLGALASAGTKKKEGPGVMRMLRRTVTVLKLTRNSGINSLRGCVTPGGHMPGDPAQCRLYAARYLELSKRAKDPARRQSLAALAKLWTKLAAELESEQALLNTLSEINFDEPFYAVPEALNLRAA